jgi:probable phosphoglycerate mutase
LKFFLVRHGETEWNKLGKFQGQVDIPLNERGRAQARDTARAARSWETTAVYASPLSRTRQFAEEISLQVGLPVQPEPRLKELDLGQLDGITNEEMQPMGEHVPGLEGKSRGRAHARWRVLVPGTTPGLGSHPGY